jgi:hypothetical protein
MRCRAQKRERKIMMKKNISLCALMMLLSTGLHASDNSLDSLASDPAAAQQDLNITAQSKNIIAKAFQSLDDWMYRDSLIAMKKYTGPNMSMAELAQLPKEKQADQFMQQSSGYEFEGGIMVPDSSLKGRANLKIPIAVEAINKAFASLDSATNSTYTTPVKDAVMRAVRTFSQESNIDSKVLKGIVDSAKIALLAPIKIAVNLTGSYAGMAVGAAGGAGAGFGAAINRTATKMSDRNRAILANKADNVATKAAKIFAATTYTALGGIVNAAVLTSYGAAEGVVVGDLVGQRLAQQTRTSFFGLDKNPAIDKRRAEQAAAKEAQTKSANQSISDNLFEIGKNDSGYSHDEIYVEGANSNEGQFAFENPAFENPAFEISRRTLRPPSEFLAGQAQQKTSQQGQSEIYTSSSLRPEEIQYSNASTVAGLEKFNAEHQAQLARQNSAGLSSVRVEPVKAS